MKRILGLIAILIFNVSLPPLAAAAEAEWVTLDSLPALAEAASRSGQRIRLQPGVYQMSEYLTDERLQAISDSVDRSQRRPPVPMFVFEGSDNVFDMEGVVWEIDTTLYAKLPQGGYPRCIIVRGQGNRIQGLAIRNTGPNKGSGGNVLSLEGDGNTLEDVSLRIHGSFPYGYGDLFGKGGPNLLSLQKQSGIQVLGSNSLLKRCRVYSRAFGHCFYIQAGEGSRLEDCYAEGVMRSTTEMLTETSGVAKELGFRSVYANRDGRFLIAPGYTKSLSEDGFRTYGGAGRVTLRNCVAINTRAGFEIGNRDDATSKTVLQGCIARGCERAFLIGSNVIARDCRGDTRYGPLLYLRGGHSSDVEIALISGQPDSLVHALATIAGENHRVSFILEVGERPIMSLPILLGFGMPAHAEMASPIEAAPAKNITLINRIAQAPVIVGEEAIGCAIESAGIEIQDADTRTVKGAGKWPSGGG